jgi:hypothetical protein
VHVYGTIVWNADDVTDRHSTVFHKALILSITPWESHVVLCCLLDLSSLHDQLWREIWSSMPRNPKLTDI